MVRNFLEQLLVDHWANKIATRELDPNEEIFGYLAKMEDIIGDVPSNYHQWPNLAYFQIDFLAGVVNGELKTFAEWVWQNEDFNLFFYFCERIRHLLDELYEVIEEEPLEEPEDDPSEDEEEENWLK